MIRLLYCYGQKDPSKKPGYFFLALPIRSQDERIKHRDLSLQDIHRYTFERNPSLRITRFQEDPALSMLAQKMYADLLGRQDDNLAMDIIERLLDGGAAIALGTATIHPLIDVAAAA
jgi:hypothetical protein